MRQWFGNRELVEITRVVIINGTPEEVAKVLDKWSLSSRRRRQLFGFGKGRVRKLRSEATLDHRASGDGL
jgi:hypothetical protein